MIFHTLQFLYMVSINDIFHTPSFNILSEVDVLYILKSLYIVSVNFFFKMF